MLSSLNTTAGAINDLILALTRGNLCGVINPTTNLCFDYKTKGTSHVKKWETALRALIKDTYELPIWMRTDILHSITGIPHLRVLLMQEAVSRIKRWRYLTGSRSPLDQLEARDLRTYLSSSPLIAKVASTLNVENPLLETTDWKRVDIALKRYGSEHW